MKKYICFMDFEYTTTGNMQYDKDNNFIELLSMAGVITDENGNTIDEFHEIIKPTKNTVIHSFCNQLTGITQDMADSSLRFENVANNFMNFINKYRNEELYIYVWGDFDTHAIERTFEITSYNGDFKYIKDKIVNLQKRICCSITYKGEVIKSILGLQNVKKVFNLEIGYKQHNALYDARDLKDVYFAFKNKYPKNKKVIEYLYEKKLLDKELNYFNKPLYLNRIPGEFKYGLANLFQKVTAIHKNVSSLKFNKKTMVFENYNYDSSQNLKLDSEIIRYSKIQMILKIEYHSKLIHGYNFDVPVFAIYLATISNKLGYSTIINTTHYIPINKRTISHVKIFLRTMKRYDNLYDINNVFDDKLNMLETFNLNKKEA